MASYELTNFKLGLDTRRSVLTSQPGALSTLTNAHINEGAEVEKRKALVPLYLPTGMTYGLQATLTGLTVFGSGFALGSAQASLTNGTVTFAGVFTGSDTFLNSMVGVTVSVTNCSVAKYNATNYVVSEVSATGGTFIIETNNPNSLPNDGTPVSVTGLLFATGVLPGNVTFQQLVSPNTSDLQMTSYVSSTLFGGDIFVAASFADNYTYCFYNGTLVPDFTNGLVTSWQGTVDQIASAIGTMVNFTGSSANEVTGEPIYTATVSGNEISLFANPNVTSGAPFTSVVTLNLENSSTGSLTASPVTTGGASTAAVQAAGSFTILAGNGNGTYATGTITVNNETTSSGLGDSIEIGGQLYWLCTAAYQAANPNTSWFVTVGANTTATAANLAAAINLTGTAGVTYGTGFVANAYVSASPSSNVITLTALQSGTLGNSVTLVSEDSNHNSLTRSGATLTGGINGSYISTVNVNGNNILSAVIPWDVSPTQTAIDVATNINANTYSNGGFTATASAGVVTIYSLAASAASYNAQSVSVVVVGEIAIQQMAFEVVSVSNGFEISGITVGGTQIMAASVTASSDTPTTFAAKVVTEILAGSDNMTAVVVPPVSPATNAIVYVSPLTSTSASTPGSMVITYSGTGSLGAGTSATLVVALSTYSISGSVEVLSSGPPGDSRYYNVNNTTKTYITNPVTALPSGGVTPYTYKWQYAGLGNSRISCRYPTSAITSFSFASNATVLTNYTELWTCTVTDSASNSVTSQPLVVIL